jgi:tetratricopeptide (TPR) repeat protein
VAQELGQLEEAERLLAEAVERFPQETMPWMDRARLADKRALWDEAHEHWSNVQALQPSSLEAPIGRAAALRRLRRFEEAEVLIKAAMARLPDEPLLWEEYALIASARENWSEALRRLLNGRRRFPSVNAFRQRIFETKLRIAEIDPINVPDWEEIDVGGAASDRVRALVMRFESLGGTGHGCEFGIFQRHFGAEPLGLLRWADLLPEQLMAALETEFEGVGTAEQTVLFVPDHGGRPEYWTSDRKFHMAMRSFVFPDEIPHDRMFQQVTRRLQFLRSKLIDDLRAGDKIFVYKNMQRNLTAAEVTRLHEAVRRYGNNMLLYAQYADADHPFGTVEVNAPGLMIGYIDRFTHHPETNEYLGPSAEGFRRVCEEAVSLWTRATEGEIVCR